jgi:hypothetical protein
VSDLKTKKFRDREVTRLEERARRAGPLPSSILAGTDQPLAIAPSETPPDSAPPTPNNAGSHEPAIDKEPTK